MLIVYCAQNTCVLYDMFLNWNCKQTKIEKLCRIFAEKHLNIDKCPAKCCLVTQLTCHPPSTLIVIIILDFLCLLTETTQLISSNHCLRHPLLLQMLCWLATLCQLMMYNCHITWHYNCKQLGQMLLLHSWPSHSRAWTRIVLDTPLFVRTDLLRDINDVKTTGAWKTFQPQ